MKVITLLVLCSFIAYAGLRAFENPPAPAAPRWAQESSLAQRSLQKIVANTDVTNLLVFIDNIGPGFAPRTLFDLAALILKSNHFTWQEKNKLLSALSNKAKEVAPQSHELPLITLMRAATNLPEVSRWPILNRAITAAISANSDGVELFLPHLDLNNNTFDLYTARDIIFNSRAPLNTRADILRAILRTSPEYEYFLTNAVWQWSTNPQAVPILSSLLQEFKGLINKRITYPPFSTIPMVMLDWLYETYGVFGSQEDRTRFKSAVALLRAHGAKTSNELIAYEKKNMALQDVSH